MHLEGTVDDRDTGEDNRKPLCSKATAVETYMMIFCVIRELCSYIYI
jgi:hypothetical protein